MIAGFGSFWGKVRKQVMHSSISLLYHMSGKERREGRKKKRECGASNRRFSPRFLPGETDGDTYA